VDSLKMTRYLSVIYVDKFRDIIIVSIARASVASRALVQSDVIVWSMMISIVGQLVFVAKTAQPNDLSERCEPVLVSPVLGYNRFALLCHVAEHN
jgi:hypothetical protein